MKSYHKAIILLLLLSHGITQGGESSHTDGIEPYYHPADLQAYLDSLPPEDAKYMLATEEEMKWWKDARLGGFICWGPSAMLKCSIGWGRNGPRPHHRTDGKTTSGISHEVYDTQYKKFVAKDFDADAWVKMTRDAGQKYLIWLTKHHDGFVMFDTQTTDYNIMNTPFGRDATKEIVDACHKYGIKVFLYYSQPDWMDPFYKAGDFEQFREKFMYPQIRELLTKYGKIDGMWFDGLGKHPDMWGGAALIKMVRELQPGLIINHRFSPKHWHAGDFDGPERDIGRFQINRPWETCTTIGGGWAWQGDAPAMSLKNVISMLVTCAGNGGNLALGVGPNGDGTVLPDHQKRFLELGQWLGRYGESIYATSGGPYISGPWGAATSKGNTVYIHLLGECPSGKIKLPALPAKILSAELLTGGEVNVSQAKEYLNIAINPEDIHPLDTIIALTTDRPVKEIAPVATAGQTLTIGAAATASSEYGPTRPASSVVASNATEFSEGIFVKTAWTPGKGDDQPWLQVTLNTSQTIDQILIRESRFGRTSTILDFNIEAKINDQWEVIHNGNEIGGGFGLILGTPVTSDSFRIVFRKWSGGININSFDLFDLSL